MSKIKPHVISIAVVAALLIVTACETKTTLIEVARVLAEERTLVASKIDTTISLKINEAFLDQKNGLYRDISFDVYENDVLLTGWVKAPESKRMASALVAATPNVRKVFNEIQVASSNNILEKAIDITIENRIRFGLKSAKGVRSINMRWRSVGGTIYLFGRALSKSEQDKAITIIKEIEGFKSLVNIQKVVPKRD